MLNLFLCLHADVMVSVPAMLSVNEGDGMVQVCATLSAIEATERNFTITLDTRDGTGIVWCTTLGKTYIFINFAAFAGSDYTSVFLEAVFTSGSTDNSTACVIIYILDDGTIEMEKTFTVILTTLDPDVFLGNYTTNITIFDSLGKYCNEGRRYVAWWSTICIMQYVMLMLLH